MNHSIYPSFGDMGSWHLVPNAPDGALESRADWVASIWEEARGRLATKSPVRPMILKALALELTVAFADEGRRPPDRLLRALAGLLELPDTFLDDPVPVFQGDTGGGRPPVSATARSRAMQLDREHFHANGSMMATHALAVRLAAELKLDRPYSRASLDRWRLEPKYAEWVAFPITPLPKTD